MLPHVIKEELDKIVEADTTQKMQKGAYELLLTGQEVIVTQGKVAIALRPDIGLWTYITVDPSNMKVQKVEASKYLELKENLSGQCKLLQTVSLANQPHDCPWSNCAGQGTEQKACEEAQAPVLQLSLF